MKEKILRFCIIAITFWMVDDIIAQQEAQYTQYMYNMNIVNPAYAGSKAETLSVALMGRTQWVNVPGAPSTATISLHKPLRNGLGVGLSLLADKVGPIDEQFIFADVSYTIPVGYYDNLAFGVKGGVTVLQAKLADIKTYLPDDENFAHNINMLKPNFGFGLYYYSDIYYAGVSIPGLLKTEYLKEEGGIYTSVNTSNHLFLTGGYVFDIDYDWKFKPHAMVKMTQGAPLSVDISANFLYDEKIEGGLSYRWGDSVSGLVNFKINKSWRVGYAYDYTVSDLRKYNSGTHEIFLLYDLNNTLTILSPRFF